jgi:hypothetical protein
MCRRSKAVAALSSGRERGVAVPSGDVEHSIVAGDVDGLAEYLICNVVPMIE